MPYGVASSLWIRLPPDDQAAVKALSLGLPIPAIGGYAPTTPANFATTNVAPTKAAPTNSSPNASTAAPPATLRGTPVKVEVTAAKKNAEEVAHTLAVREGRVQTLAGSKPSVLNNNAQHLDAQTTDARAHPRTPGQQAKSLTGTAASSAIQAAEDAQSARRHAEPIDTLSRTRRASRARPTPQSTTQTAHRSIQRITKPAPHTYLSAAKAQVAYRHDEPITKPATHTYLSAAKAQVAYRHDEPITKVASQYRPTAERSEKAQQGHGVATAAVARGATEAGALSDAAHRTLKNYTDAAHELARSGNPANATRGRLMLAKIGALRKEIPNLAGELRATSAGAGALGFIFDIETGESKGYSLPESVARAGAETVGSAVGTAAGEVAAVAICSVAGVVTGGLGFLVCAVVGGAAGGELGGVTAGDLWDAVRTPVFELGRKALADDKKGVISIIGPGFGFLP